jgi:AcrR family transcriptional regulator
MKRNLVQSSHGNGTTGARPPPQPGCGRTISNVCFERSFESLEIPVSSSQPHSGGDRAAPPAAASQRDTKERLLDAAERLFAERGFEGTSMRAVTQAADASVSAANYHFGSKEALLQAALVRRLEPLNRRRLEALDALEAAGGAAVPVEALLEAFLRPGFEAQWDAGDGRPPLRNIAAQLYADPHEMVAALKVDLFVPVITRFIDALARALPDRSRDELVLDFQFCIGLLVHVIGGHARIDRKSEGPPPLPDERVLQRMVSFTAAGLRAKALAKSSVRGLREAR